MRPWGAHGGRRQARPRQTLMRSRLTSRRSRSATLSTASTHISASARLYRPTLRGMIVGGASIDFAATGSDVGPCIAANHARPHPAGPPGPLGPQSPPFPFPQHTRAHTPCDTSTPAHILELSVVMQVLTRGSRSCLDPVPKSKLVAMRSSSSSATLQAISYPSAILRRSGSVEGWLAPPVCAPSPPWAFPTGANGPATGFVSGCAQLRRPPPTLSLEPSSMHAGRGTDHAISNPLLPLCPGMCGAGT